MSNEPKLLTQKETEERTGIPPSTLLRWIAKGQFPAPIQPAGRRGKRLYKLEEIESFERGEYKNVQQ